MRIDFNSDVFTGLYDNCPFWSSHFAYTLFDEIDWIDGAAVLDIGTGTGFPAIEIAERMGKKATVHAIDLWDAALKRGADKATQLDVGNVVFLNASVLAMPFQNDLFDLVISNNCLNNVAEYDSALRECRRVMKPGGKLIQTFNLPDTLREFYGIFRQLLMKKGMPREIEALDAHIFSKRRSTEYTKRAVENVGLKVLNASEHDFAWPFLNGTSFLNHSFIQMAWLPCWQEILPAPLRESFFQELEARLNAYAEASRGLHFRIPYACVAAQKLPD